MAAAAPASPDSKFKRDGFILSSTGPLTKSYKLDTKKLGQGTYGSVCKAQHIATGQIRAVKTISKAQVRCKEVVPHAPAAGPRPA